MFASTDLQSSPALLKLDLYCKGMRVDESCLVEEDGGRQILRTRAGLGSGLELVLPGGLWTNVPVVESFADSSPYILERAVDGYCLRDGDELVASVQLSPKPLWYGRRTSRGTVMSRVGTLQGTYLGIYPARVSDFWVQEPTRVNCGFCSVGLNLGVDEATEKSVEDVLDVVAARRVPNRRSPTSTSTRVITQAMRISTSSSRMCAVSKSGSVCSCVSRLRRTSTSAATAPFGPWASTGSRSVSRFSSAPASPRCAPVKRQPMGWIGTSTYGRGSSDWLRA